MPRVHQLLRARPRLILGLLLAFSIQTLRPGLHQTSHQHPGDEHAHSHPHVLLGGKAPAATRTTVPASPQDRETAARRDTTEPTLEAAHTLGVHVHLAAPLHAAAIASPVRLSPSIDLTLVAPAPPPSPRSALGPLPQARAPPPSFA